MLKKIYRENFEDARLRKANAIPPIARVDILACL